jgi:alpha-D-xyloside xylohydrolase
MRPVFLNNPVDVSPDFHQLENDFFIPGAVKSFDKDSGKGSLEWIFHRWTKDWFFNKVDKHLQRQDDPQAPFQDYDTHPRCDFSISFINSRTIRLRMKTSPTPVVEHPSLMIEDRLPADDSWRAIEDESTVRYSGNEATVLLQKDFWKMEIQNPEGKPLIATQTRIGLQGMHAKALPFLFMRRHEDNARYISASFTLFPGERIYGCGESFTPLNKIGQKLVLFTSDAQSAASPEQYKPIPFFMSNRGYGVFIHASTPVTIDFGQAQAGTQTIYPGADELDLFFFVGTPVEILKEYTGITGRSPLPPLWSFGLWMSRFSYRSQEEVLMVANRLREMEIPCDVIHIDAGWFRKGINCDFEFSPGAFPDPTAMISELGEKGFKTSLWQIPYFTPLNPLFTEVVEKKLFVTDGNGNIPTEDAILDFSREEAITWYREKLETLFHMGIAAIKADFGEAAPVQGWYASGRSGWYEHNLYPLRYNKLVAEITRDITGETMIWARSAWAGSQRYPIHWGGDAEVSDTGMAGSLRGGLSLGLSGFSFWSHDIGGFSDSPKEELMLRWAFFGLLSSHSRVHGFPPREPWEFSLAFQEKFRRIVELKYRLMPYVYTQAALSCLAGLPLLRAMFLEYPDDPTAWMIEDQFLLGTDLLVAPLMEAGIKGRKIYLPPGAWVDYQTGKTYPGEKWLYLDTGPLPGILLVREGALIPQVPIAQSTSMIKWDQLSFIAFGNQHAKGIYYHENEYLQLEAKKEGKEWKLVSENKAGWKVLEFDAFS